MLRSASSTRTSHKRAAQPAPSAPATGLPPDAHIDRSRPIPDQVYALLRRTIVTLRLPPGAAIVEKDITHQLGISRTPVRDAVRLLAEEGLINIKPQSGTFVALINLQQLEEGRLIRRALEIEGMRLAAKNVTQDKIDALQDLIAAQERAGGRGDHIAFLDFDDRFHRLISEMSGHLRLWKVIHSVKAQLDRMRLMSAPLPGQDRRVIGQHQAIADALQKHNEERCVRALEHHLDDAYAQLSKVIEQHRELMA
jgi:GntR family transcriptional regulator, rspAB operon transcriptional repressor